MVKVLRQIFLSDQYDILMATKKLTEKQKTMIMSCEK